MPSASVAGIRAAIAAHRDAGTCHLCEKPVVDGEAHHGATGAHWDCHSKQESDAVKADARLAQLAHSIPGKPRAPRKREGEGKTALKAKALAVSALEAYLDAKLHSVSIWNQQGVHRGPRWDLDAWGLYFKFERDGHTFGGSASSLATMTQCVKWQKLDATPSGGAFSFDLGPHKAKKDA